MLTRFVLWLIRYPNQLFRDFHAYRLWFWFQLSTILAILVIVLNRIVLTIDVVEFVLLFFVPSGMLFLQQRKQTKTSTPTSIVQSMKLHPFRSFLWLEFISFFLILYTKTSFSASAYDEIYLFIGFFVLQIIAYLYVVRRVRKSSKSDYLTVYPFYLLLGFLFYTLAITA
jgi:hypothetical protein